MHTQSLNELTIIMTGRHISIFEGKKSKYKLNFKKSLLQTIDPSKLHALGLSKFPITCCFAISSTVLPSPKESRKLWFAKSTENYVTDTYPFSSCNYISKEEVLKNFKPTRYSEKAHLLQ